MLVQWVFLHGPRLRSFAERNAQLEVMDALELHTCSLVTTGLSLTPTPMAYQDHLTRQTEQLGMVLRRLLSAALGKGDQAQPVLQMDAIEQALSETLDLQPESLASMAPEALLGTLQQHLAATEANQDLLADLLLAMAECTADEARKVQLLRQALAILEHLNATSNIFNMERHGKVGRLRGLV